MPTREHHIKKEDRGPADGTLGQGYGVGHLCLSADQIDHFNEKGDWKPQGRTGIPWRMLAIVLGGLALILLAYVLIFVVWPSIV